MAQINSTNCCGLGIIDSIRNSSDWKSVILQVKRTHPRRAHYVFSQATGTYDQSRYGENFAAYIRKHKLGTVVETVPRKNPNSGNMLTIFTWTVSPSNLAKFK